VFADPSVVLGHLDATVTAAVCTRATDADAGLCIVEVPVKSAWFVATATEDSDRTLSISANFVVNHHCDRDIENSYCYFRD
jgi:hypothetical protein